MYQVIANSVEALRYSHCVKYGGIMLHCKGKGHPATRRAGMAPSLLYLG